ncbi:MAG: hypothetical protein JWM12_2914 [Ilumatobacteraceae bacterium]|nr:hypothetical protein [Ilumatobacteraceae bacterium]
MLEWLIVADDRSGALEVAGEAARFVGPVWVTVGVPAGPNDVEASSAARAAVVDAACRHREPSVAARAVMIAGAAPARRHAHKIDSMLRGNWAHELVAVQRATGDRVLLVPAFPAVGRTCRGGVVHVDGVPVGAEDVRRGAASPRPSVHLAAAGASAVEELAGEAAVTAWLAGTGSFAVCDASTERDLATIADAWRASSGVRVAGTAGSIAAAVAVSCATPAIVDRRSAAMDGEVLVVCGSLHAVARAQVDVLRARAAAGITVMTTPVPDTPSVTAAAAEEAVTQIGAAARELLATRRFDVLVIVGGDTAAAVLGDAPMLVGGTVAAGLPWSRRGDGSGPLVVTKAGGFGGPTTLVELLLGRSGSEAQ